MVPQQFCVASVDFEAYPCSTACLSGVQFQKTYYFNALSNEIFQLCWTLAGEERSQVWHEEENFLEESQDGEFISSEFSPAGFSDRFADVDSNSFLGREHVFEVLLSSKIWGTRIQNWHCRFAKHNLSSLIG